MEPRPFTNEAPSTDRANFPGEQLSRKVERSHLTLVLNVEMGRIVVIEKHSNDEAEKC